MLQQLSIFDDGVLDPAVPNKITEAFQPAFHQMKLLRHVMATMNASYSRAERNLTYRQMANSVHYCCNMARKRLEEQGIDYKSRPYFK